MTSKELQVNFQTEFLEELSKWDDSFYTPHSFDSNTISQACLSLALQRKEVPLNELLLVGKSGSISTKSYQSLGFTQINVVDNAVIDTSMKDKQHPVLFNDLSSNIIKTKRGSLDEEEVKNSVEELIKSSPSSFTYFTLLPVKLARLVTLIILFSRFNCNQRILICDLPPSSVSLKNSSQYTFTPSSQHLPAPFISFVATPRVDHTVSPTLSLSVAESATNTFHQVFSLISDTQPSNSLSPSTITNILDLIRFQLWTRLIPSQKLIPNPNPSKRVTFPTLPIFTTSLPSQKQGVIPPPESDYTFTAVDSPSSMFPMSDPKSTIPVPCSIVIVPQGRESEWLFSSDEGRSNLISSTRALRTIFSVFTHPPKISLDAIKNELNPFARRLLPKDERGRTVSNVPYVTVGEDPVGKRVRVETGRSEMSGEFWVEDVYIAVDKEAEEEPGKEQQKKKKKSNEPVEYRIFRRLIFASNPNLIQSECQIERGDNPSQVASFSFIKPSTGYQQTLVASFSLLLATPLAPLLSMSPPRPLSCCLIGLGAACLVSSLLKLLSFPLTPTSHSIHFDVAELDGAMEQVSRTSFGFTPKEGEVDVSIGDGVDFVQKRVSATADGSYDVLIVDVDAKERGDGISCPPAPFRTEAFVRNMFSALSASGVAMINLASRSVQASTQYLDLLRSVFGSVIVVNVPEDINKIVICFKDALSTPLTVTTVSEHASSFVNQCRAVLTKRDGATEKPVDLEWMKESMSNLDVGASGASKSKKKRSKKKAADASVTAEP
ncbi:putative methyltransferase domain protein [Blattamonas nauphoetae]|uniref:Methyltransferase domain protein n=1 Tax=Blattamonas nauphoetae TaxID=2049346 RepID=A0ABQ9XK77_9EUKA|nr:putative methyltransferase domain protein [Blattamonas nauphoetae]